MPEFIQRAISTQPKETSLWVLEGLRAQRIAAALPREVWRPQHFNILTAGGSILLTERGAMKSFRLFMPPSAQQGRKHFIIRGKESPFERYALFLQKDLSELFIFPIQISNDLNIKVILWHIQQDPLCLTLFLFFADGLNSEFGARPTYLYFVYFFFINQLIFQV